MDPTHASMQAQKHLACCRARRRCSLLQTVASIPLACRTLQALVEACLQEDREQRPSFEEVLKRVGAMLREAQEAAGNIEADASST